MGKHREHLPFDHVAKGTDPKTDKLTPGERRRRANALGGIQKLGGKIARGWWSQRT